MSAVYLAFDLGAESGRAVLGRFDGEHVTLEEVHRFPNTPVKLSDGLHWDVLLILAEIKVRDKDGKVKGYRAAYVVHTAEGMKRRYLSGKRREDVRDKMAKALSDRVDGLVFDARALTVGEYLDRWLKDVKDTVRQSTHERYVYAIEPHIRPAIGRIKLKDLKSAQVRWFYRDRLDYGFAPATVQKLHAVLHKALEAAVSDGLIPRNAAAGLKLPRIIREEIDPLNQEEARRLLEAAREDKLETLYVLALNTGMRQGELLALKWDDVDLKRSVPRLPRRGPLKAEHERFRGHSAHKGKRTGDGGAGRDRRRLRGLGA